MVVCEGIRERRELLVRGPELPDQVLQLAAHRRNLLRSRLHRLERVDQKVESLGVTQRVRRLLHRTEGQDGAGGGREPGVWIGGQRREDGARHRLGTRHGDPRVPRHLAELVQRGDPTRAAGIGDERGSLPLRRGRGAPAGCR